MNHDTEHLFSILSRSPRRQILLTLDTHGDLTLADLADEIACHTYDKPLSEIPPDTVCEIYFSLYHKHIPALVDVGLIVYEQECDLVMLTDQGNLLNVEFLERLETHLDSLH